MSDTELTDVEIGAALVAALEPPGLEWKEIESLIRLVGRRLIARGEITEAKIEKVANAMDAKRRELIAQPLARLWPELARAALEAAQKA